METYGLRSGIRRARGASVVALTCMVSVLACACTPHEPGGPEGISERAPARATPPTPHTQRPGGASRPTMSAQDASLPAVVGRAHGVVEAGIEQANRAVYRTRPPSITIYPETIVGQTNRAPGVPSVIDRIRPGHARDAP